MHYVFVLLAVLLAALPAHAGPWARAPGEVFLSVSSNMQAPLENLAAGRTALDRYDSAYLEFGLGRRLTFGAEYGHGDTRQEALAFLRYTFTPTDSPTQVAIDVGGGLTRIDRQADSPLAHIGLSLGHGFEMAPRGWMPLDLSGGWLSLDALAVHDLTDETTRWKVEGTLGLHAWDRHRLMLQLVAEDWPGQDLAYGLNPSVVFHLRENTQLEIGLRAGFFDRVNMGLELGLWHRF